ncbi:hypothetical protein ACT691_12770 [Vibrio metschnikovii]
MLVFLCGSASLKTRYFSFDRFGVSILHERTADHFLLAPTGYHTLAVTVFSRTSEGLMAEAAPLRRRLFYFSSLSIGLILNREKIKGTQ